MWSSGSRWLRRARCGGELGLRERGPAAVRAGTRSCNTTRKAGSRRGRSRRRGRNIPREIASNPGRRRAVRGGYAPTERARIAPQRRYLREQLGRRRATEQERQQSILVGAQEIDLVNRARAGVIRHATDIRPGPPGTFAQIGDRQLWSAKSTREDIDASGSPDCLFETTLSHFHPVISGPDD